MSVEAEIHRKLSETFSPDTLEIIDESEDHRGHSGWREGGETHFRVRIIAEQFADMSRIARHRAVHAALGKDLVTRIHALALEISG